MRRFINVVIFALVLVVLLISYKAYGQEKCSAEYLENFCEKSGFTETYYDCYHDTRKSCKKISNVWYTAKYDSCILKSDKEFCRVWAHFQEGLCTFVCNYRGKLPYPSTRAAGKVMCVAFWDEVMCREDEDDGKEEK